MKVPGCEGCATAGRMGCYIHRNYWIQLQPLELPHTGMLRYLFPLRPDVTVELIIPRDLTVKEHDRLVKFLEALAVPDESPAPEGT